MEREPCQEQGASPRTGAYWACRRTDLAVRVKRLLRENWFFLALMSGLVTAFLLLRTHESSVATVDELDALLVSGQPTLVELYSNT